MSYPVYHLKKQRVAVQYRIDASCTRDSVQYIHKMLLDRKCAHLIKDI